MNSALVGSGWHTHVCIRHRCLRGRRRPISDANPTATNEATSGTPKAASSPQPNSDADAGVLIHAMRAHAHASLWKSQLSLGTLLTMKMGRCLTQHPQEIHPRSGAGALSDDTGRVWSGTSTGPMTQRNPKQAT